MKTPLAVAGGLVAGLGLGMAFGYRESRPGGIFSDVSGGRDAPERGGVAGSRSEEGGSQAGVSAGLTAANAASGEQGELAKGTPAVGYDGTPESLARVLGQAGVDKDRIGMTVWFFAYLDNGGISPSSIGDEGGTMSYMEEITKVVTRVLGEEEGNRIAALAMNGFRELADKSEILTPEERAGVKRIEEEYLLAEYSLRGDPADDGGEEEGMEDWSEPRRERDRKLMEFLGEERYWDYRLHRENHDLVKAGELAGLTSDQMRGWVKLDDEFVRKEQASSSIADERLRDETVQRIRKEHEERRSYLLGARLADFEKYRDYAYWELRRGLRKAPKGSPPVESADAIYGAALPWRRRMADLRNEEERARLREEAGAALKAGFPEVEKDLLDSLLR